MWGTQETTVRYLSSVSRTCTVLSHLTLLSTVEMMDPGHYHILFYFVLFCFFSVLVLISDSPDLHGKQILIWQLRNMAVHLTAASAAPKPARHRWTPINIVSAESQGGIGFPQVSLCGDCRQRSILDSCRRVPAFNSNTVNSCYLK